MDEYVKNEIYKPLGLKRTTHLPLANGFTTEDVAATSFGNPYEYAMVDEIDYPLYYDCTADLDAFRTSSPAGATTPRQGECNDGNAWMANGVAGHAGAVLCQTATTTPLATQALPGTCGVVMNKTNKTPSF